MDRKPVKINIEVEITGCIDCPFCKQKWNELTMEMENKGIPSSVWICEKGAYGKLEECRGILPSALGIEEYSGLISPSYGTYTRTYYSGERFRPEYPPYFGCPYFTVDKLTAFVNELNKESISHSGINEDIVIELWKKYGITMEGYEFPVVNPEIPDEDNNDSTGNENTEGDNNDSNTDNSGDTNEGTTTDPEDNTEDTPSDSGDNKSGDTNEGPSSDSGDNTEDTSTTPEDNNSDDTNEGITTDPEDNNSGNTDGTEDNNDTDISDEIIDPEVQPETDENETEEGELNV